MKYIYFLGSCFKIDSQSTVHVPTTTSVDAFVKQFDFKPLVAVIDQQVPNPFSVQDVDKITLDVHFVTTRTDRVDAVFAKQLDDFPDRFLNIFFVPIHDGDGGSRTRVRIIFI